MKLRNIAKKNGKEVNLELHREKKLVLPNQEFEIQDDKRAKELLSLKIDNTPIVEIVKEVKSKAENKEE